MLLQPLDFHVDVRWLCMHLQPLKSTCGFGMQLFCQYVVLACSFFVPSHSDIKSQRLYFTYNVRITNNSNNTMQLLNRHWVITNAYGAKQEIR